MPAIPSTHARALPAADQPHDVEHVQALVEGMLAIAGFHVLAPAGVQPDGGLPPPFDLARGRDRALRNTARSALAAPFFGAPLIVDWVGYVEVRVFEDGSTAPHVGAIVERNNQARAQRLALDKLRGKKSFPLLQLTPAEISRGMVRPHWHTYRHAACGARTVFEFDERAIGLALDPRRPSQHATGIVCTTCAKAHPIGERGEYTWLDTAGNEIPVKVGT